MKRGSEKRTVKIDEGKGGQKNGVKIAKLEGTTTATMRYETERISQTVRTVDEGESRTIHTKLRVRYIYIYISVYRILYSGTKGV